MYTYVIVNIFLLMIFPFLSFQRAREDNEENFESSDDENYVPYIPIKQRKKTEVKRKKELSCVVQLQVDVVVY